MDSTEYRVPIVLSEDGKAHIPLPQGMQLAVWSVPNGGSGGGESVNPSDIISKEPNNPIVLDAAGKIKLDMSRVVNPSDSVLYLENNLVSSQIGIELDNSTLILTGVDNQPIATVELPIVPGLPTVAEFLFDYTPPAGDDVAGGREKGTYLHLRFAMSNGESKDIYVNFSSLDVADYKVSDGLTLDKHVIGLKLAPDSGLSVTSQGLSVSGAYSAGSGIDITPQRAISVRAGTGLTFNSGELQALPYTAGNGVSINNRVIAIRLADNGGLMLADGELSVKLAPDGYLVKTDTGLGVSQGLLDLIGGDDGCCDEAMARANEAYELADGLEGQIAGAYEAAESAASSAELAQTQAATAIETANNKVDRSGDTMTGPLCFLPGGITYADIPLCIRNYSQDYSGEFPLYIFYFGNSVCNFTMQGGGGAKTKGMFLGTFPAQLENYSDNSVLVKKFADDYLAYKTDIENLPALIDANTQSIADINDRLNNLDIPEVDLSEIEAELANKANSSVVQTLADNLGNKVSKSGDTMTGALRILGAGGYSSSLASNSLYFSDNFFPYYDADNDTGNIRSLVAIYSYKQGSTAIASYLGIGAYIKHNWKHLFGFNVLSYLQPSLNSAPILGIEFDSLNNTVKTFCNTPISDSNDDSIANTEWVNQRLNTFDTTLGLTEAKNNGQINNLPHAGQIGTVDANSFTKSGLYMIHGGSDNANWAVNNWPIKSLYGNQLRVSISFVIIMQIFYTPTLGVWYRYGNINGPNDVDWHAWYSISGRIESLTIYISKSGSDLNTGFDQSYPVASFSRALQIADGLNCSSLNLRVGAGNWTSIYIYNKSYTVSILPYDGQPTSEVSEDTMPKFDLLQIRNTQAFLTSIIASVVQAYRGGFTIVQSGSTRIKLFQVTENSYGYIYAFNSGHVYEIGDGSSNIGTGIGFYVTTNGFLYVGAIPIVLVNSFIVDDGKYFVTLDGNSNLALHSMITVTSKNSAVFQGGRKYYLAPGSRILSGYTSGAKPAVLDQLPGTLAGVDYPGTIYNGIPKGLSASVASTSMLGLPLSTIPELPEGEAQSLEAVKQDYISRLNQEATQAICAGFPYEINGEEYHISYNLLDQINLNDNATIALGDSESRFDVSVTDSEGERLTLRVSARIIQDIHKYAVISHKNPILADLRSRINKIRFADSVEKITEIYLNS